MSLAHRAVPSSGSTAIRSLVCANLFSDEEHRRLIALAFANHHRAVDRDLFKLATHRIHSCLICGELVALTAQSGCRCPLRYTHNLKC
jgi:hypothetical protein